MVLIGLGSNLGASSGIIQKAILALSVFADGDIVSSGLWRTSPVNCPPDSDDFINAVAGFEPRRSISAQVLLAGLKQLEQEFGRCEQVQKNAPRELDLDLLVFGELQMEGVVLTLPHPRAKERRFVLAPAAQVAPELIWPGTDSSIRALLAGLVSDEVVTPLR